MSYNRCKDTHKFGNKYLLSAYKTQVDFRSHFSGKKVRLIVREIWYMMFHTRIFKSLLCISLLCEHYITFMAMDHYKTNTLNAPTFIIINLNMKSYDITYWYDSFHFSHFNTARLF